MKTHSFQGIIPIAAAPFTTTGLLDKDSYQQMIRHLIQTGVQGITLFGLATEFYKLTDEEKAVMQQILMAEITKCPEVFSMVSITDHATDVAVKRACNAEEMGADSLMLLPPFFLQPSEESILNHIRQVASNVQIPVIVQYAPSQTGVRLAPDTFVRLNHEVPNIAMIKVETQPPGRYVSRLLEQSEGRLGALVGYAGIQMPDVLDRGAAGIQPGCSFSEIYVKLYQLYKDGEKERFDRLFNKLLPYISYWMQGVELIIQAEKTILKKRGIIASDYCRAPHEVLDRKETEMIDRFLEQFIGELEGE